MPGAGGGVDGEDHRGRAAGAVVLGDVGHGRRAVLVGAEVLRRGVEQLLVEGEAAVAVLLDVDVHVDGVQIAVEIHRAAPRQGRSAAALAASRAFSTASRRATSSAGSMPASSSSTPATSLATSSGVSGDLPQVAPPLLGRRAEVLEDVRDAARAAGQVLVDERPEHRPAQARAVGDRGVDVGDGRDAALDQRVGLLPQRGLQPVGDVPGQLLAQPDRPLADRGVERHRRARRPPRRSSPPAPPRPAGSGAAG